MSEALDFGALVRVLRSASAKVKAGADVLGQLDSAIGDGDHGVAMTRAMNALEQGMDDFDGEGCQAMLQAAGWAVMSIDAGSTGPLMGSLFMGMAGAVGDVSAVDAALLAAMFEAGLTKLRSISKAKVGDKTMMDALVPAVEALKSSAESGDGVAAALSKAADAAQAGAEKTKDFQAKFGKARNLGERSIGYQDPGATSMSMLFRGLAEGAAALGA